MSSRLVVLSAVTLAVLSLSFAVTPPTAQYSVISNPKAVAWGQQPVPTAQQTQPATFAKPEPVADVIVIFLFLIMLFWLFRRSRIPDHRKRPRRTMTL